MMGHFSTVLDLPTTDYPTWISKLSTIHESSGSANTKFAKTAFSLIRSLQPCSPDAARAPAYENNGLSIFMDLGESSMRCSVLQDASLDQLGLEDVRGWVEYWRRVGSLPSV